MGNEFLLSVCISSYNKGNSCYDLIRKILNVCDQRVNVVVTDDCSDEETYKRISSIRNERYVLYRNNSNLGACKSWYETINHGTGKYLLHVLDRDYIDESMINRLIEVIDSTEIGAGYLGDCFVPTSINSLYSCSHIYEPGYKTMSEVGCMPVHPTGFLIKKSVWKENDFKLFFYDENKYGIYPHSYCLCIAGEQKRLLFIPGVFWKCLYSTSNGKSQFYKRYKSINYWWEPRSVIKTSIRMFRVLSERISDPRYLEELAVNGFVDGLYRGTIGYASVIGDKRQMSHYSLDTEEIPIVLLFLINLRYTIRYIYKLSQYYEVTVDLFKRIIKASKRNTKEILYYYL